MSEDSPFIPPRPSPYGRGVLPSPMSVAESLDTQDGPSHLGRMPPRGPYAYGPYPAPMHAPGQWAPSPWYHPEQGYPPSQGPTPGRLYGGTWAGYQQPGYGPPPGPPPQMYNYPPGHPHSAPYPSAPLPSGGTSYYPIHGAPYQPQPYGYPPPLMPGSVPLGPAPLHPDNTGHPYMERPTGETIRVDKWAVGAHCNSFSLLRRCLVRIVTVAK
jgi:hypothetical protein